MYNVKTSAPNQFAGKIKKIKTGAVNTEIIVDLKGQELSLTINNKNARALGLKKAWKLAL